MQNLRLTLFLCLLSLSLVKSENVLMYTYSKLFHFSTEMWDDLIMSMNIRYELKTRVTEKRSIPKN